MQTVNLLSDGEYYNYGLIAEEISEWILSPQFCDDFILDNEATDSDAHTLYYVQLIKVLKPSSNQSVLIQFPEDHEFLTHELQTMNVQVLNYDYEEFEPIEMESIPKWHFIKRTRFKKKLNEAFIKSRVTTLEAPKKSLFALVRKKMDQRRDDFF